MRPSVPDLAVTHDSLNLVAFGHKQLWRPTAANRLPMTQECCGLRPQQTVAASGSKIPYVLKGIVTKIITPQAINILISMLKLFL